MSTGSELVVRTSNLPALVSDNSLVSYMEQIKKFPVLSEAEEEKLVVDFQSRGDMNAAQTLVTSHLRLAAKIAFNYRHYGLPMADIISEANIGLMQAVKKFDLSKKSVWPLMPSGGLRRLSMITFCVPGLWLKSVPGLRRKNFFITLTASRPVWGFMKTRNSLLTKSLPLPANWLLTRLKLRR